MESDDELPTGIPYEAAPVVPVVLNDILDLQRNQIQNMKDEKVLDIDSDGDESNSVDDTFLDGVLAKEEVNEVHKVLRKPIQSRTDDAVIDVFGPDRFYLFNEGTTARECGCSLTTKYLPYPEGPITLMWLQLMTPRDLTSADITWCFYIMSVHSNALIVEQCFSLLGQAALSRQPQIVSLTDIITVFQNYGMKPELLSLKESTTHCVSDKVNTISVEPGEPPPPLLNVGNVEKVLITIKTAVTITRNRASYTRDDKIFLLKIIYLVSLDRVSNEPTLRAGCRAVIAAIFASFSRDDYWSQARRLCDMVTNISSHHHSLHHLASLLPPSHHHQRWVAYAAISTILRLTPRPCSNENPRVDWLLPAVAYLTPACDPYVATSLCKLVCLALGSDPACPENTRSLVRLREELNQRFGDHNDSLNDVNSSRLLLVMTRLKNALAEKLMDVSTETSDLLSAALTPVKVKVIASNTPSTDDLCHNTPDTTELPDLDSGQ